MFDKIKDWWKQLTTDNTNMKPEVQLHLTQLFRSSIRIFGGVCTGFGIYCGIAAFQASELQASLKQGMLEIKAGDREAQDTAFLLALFGASFLVAGDISRKCFPEETMQEWDLDPMSDKLDRALASAGLSDGHGWYQQFSEENFPPIPPPEEREENCRNSCNPHITQTTSISTEEKAPDQFEFSLSVVWGNKRGIIVSAVNGKGLGNKMPEESIHQEWDIAFLDGWLKRWGITANSSMDPEVLIKKALLRFFKVQRFRDLENKRFWCDRREPWMALDALCAHAIEVYSDSLILEAANLLGQPHQDLLKLKRSWEKEPLWRNIAKQKKECLSCFGCKDLEGYGAFDPIIRDPLICAIHPRGWQGEGACPDRRQIPILHSNPANKQKQATFLFFEELSTVTLHQVCDRTGISCLIYFLMGTTMLGKEWQGYLFSPYNLAVMDPDVPTETSVFWARQFLPRGYYLNQIRFVHY